MCGRYYIPEEDSAEELRAIIDDVNSQEQRRANQKRRDQAD